MLVTRLKQLTLSHGHLTIILITTIISCSSPLFKCSSFIPTLSLSASGTCLVSLGFGNGDPVFILNSGGTFVSSTTWMGTDSAGCKKNDTKHYFTLFFYTTSPWSTPPSASRSLSMHDGVTLYLILIL